MKIVLVNSKIKLYTVRTLKIRQKRAKSGSRKIFLSEDNPVVDIGDLNSTEKCLKTGIPFVLFFLWLSKKFRPCQIINGELTIEHIMIK